MIDPEGIAAQRFAVSFLGFDRSEVIAYLSDIARIIQRLNERIAALERDLTGRRQALHDDAERAFADVGRETQHILQVARETGERLIEQARDQADKELEIARAEQTQMLGEGQRARDTVQAQLEELEEARRRLVEQLYGAASMVEQVCDSLELGAVTDEILESAGHGGPKGDAVGADGADGSDAAADGDDAGSPRTQALRLVAKGDPQSSAPPEAVAEPPEAVAGPPEAVAGPPEAVAGPPEAGLALAPETPADQDLQARRNRLLTPLRRSLVEALEHGMDRLRDLQVDRIRRMGEDPDVDAISLAEAEFLSLGRLARDSLSKAFSLGAATASTLVGRQLPSANTEDPGTAQLVAESAERVAAPVRSAIEDALAADEPQWAIVDRLEQVFSSLADELVEDLAAHHLIAAFERGKLAAWVAGEVPARRWVVGAEPECFEHRCSTNADAGVVPSEDPFPTGDHAPPIHSGCTCTTVPIMEESDT